MSDFTTTVWGKPPGIVTSRTPVTIGEDEYMVYHGPRLEIVKRRAMMTTSKGTQVPYWVTVKNRDEILKVLDTMTQKK